MTPTIKQTEEDHRLDSTHKIINVLATSPEPKTIGDIVDSFNTYSRGKVVTILNSLKPPHGNKITSVDKSPPHHRKKTELDTMENKYTLTGFEETIPFECGESTYVIKGKKAPRSKFGSIITDETSLSITSHGNGYQFTARWEDGICDSHLRFEEIDEELDQNVSPVTRTGIVTEPLDTDEEEIFGRLIDHSPPLNNEKIVSLGVSHTENTKFEVTILIIEDGKITHTARKTIPLVDPRDNREKFYEESTLTVGV